MVYFSCKFNLSKVNAMKKILITSFLAVSTISGSAYASNSNIIKFVNKTDQNVSVSGIHADGDLFQCGGGNLSCISEMTLQLQPNETKEYNVEPSKYSKDKQLYRGDFGPTITVGVGDDKSYIDVSMGGAVYKTSSGEYSVDIQGSLYNGVSANSSSLMNSYPDMQKYAAVLTQSNEGHQSNVKETQITIVDVSVSS